MDSLSLSTEISSYLWSARNVMKERRELNLILHSKSMRSTRLHPGIIKARLAQIAARKKRLLVSSKTSSLFQLCMEDSHSIWLEGINTKTAGRVVCYAMYNDNLTNTLLKAIDAPKIYFESTLDQPSTPMIMESKNM